MPRVQYVLASSVPTSAWSGSADGRVEVVSAAAGAVVAALDVDGQRDPRAPAEVHGRGDRPRRVETVRRRVIAARCARPGVALDPPLLVRRCDQQEDARVVAVAPDQPLELAQVHSALDAQQAVSSMHQHAQAVAGVEQLRRGRVVRRAVRVAAHLLEPRDPEALQRVGQRRRRRRRGPGGCRCP